MASIYEKLCKGDRLTDEELVTGVEQFNKAAASLDGLGPEFELVRRECDRVSRELQTFQRSRDRQK